MVECRIPGHITGLYIFAVVNLCALLNISLVSADVIVMSTETNTTIVTMPDRQAMFGPDFPDDSFIGRVVYVIPHNACESVDPPPLDVDPPWIALIARGPCHFDKKVLIVQKAGFFAAIVHNYEGDDSVMPMGGDSTYSDQINIPSTFVGYTDGMKLANLYNYTVKNVMVKIDEYYDEPFTSYFWPFTVVVSVCFFGVIVFSIFKCIKYIQFIRRTRLSKTALKKIPIRKYKKGDHYDTCAICLDDYMEGEKLRVLPCDHTYHCKCIDPWLTKRKKTCPQCKRRVIPGPESGSESENEDDGASENTPLLGNNNNRRPANVAQSRASTFDQSAQPNVGMINEGRPAMANSAVVMEEDSTDTSDEETEGAVGGVGISDRQARTSIVVEVEPAPRSSPPQNTQDITPLMADDANSAPADSAANPTSKSHSPARAEGSINVAFASSSSNEDVSSVGSKEKKKQRQDNQVV